jgi:hypothetical protein
MYAVRSKSRCSMKCLLTISSMRQKIGVQARRQLAQGAEAPGPLLMSIRTEGSPGNFSI